MWMGEERQASVAVSPAKSPVPIVEESWWVPGPVGKDTKGKSLTLDGV